MSFGLELRRPVALGYGVSSSLIDAEDPSEKKRVNRKPRLVHNFFREMHGKVVLPEDFSETECELKVNRHDALSEYEQIARKGNVGWGRYRNDHLTFALCVAPEMAKNIVSRKLLAEQVE